MSAVVEAIDKNHATESIESLTRQLAPSHGGLKWRYDLLSSRHFPAQYYAVALQGTGSSAEEILVIAIECFDQSDEHGEQLVVSATITDRDGAILAEAPNIEIPMPPAVLLLTDPRQIIRITHEVQTAFDRMVDWVNAQHTLIQHALAIH